MPAEPLTRAAPPRAISHGPPLNEERGLGALTLPGFLRETTARHPDRIALVEHRDDGVLRWTYTRLWAEANRVARALIACGLGHGGRVAVLMTNRAEFLSAAFGIGLAGGVAVPLSTFSTPDELDHLLSASACSILLFERTVLKKDFAAMLTALEPAVATAAPGTLASPHFPFLRHLVALDDGSELAAVEPWDAFLHRGNGVPAALVAARVAAITPADPGVLFFSSGSTAKPKGILSAHRGVAIQLWRMAPQQALADGVVSWTANGFFWSGNFAMVVGATLAAGGTMVLQRTFRPDEALALMAAERVTFPFAWPHQVAQLIAAPDWLSTDLSSLREVGTESPLAAHPTVRTEWIEPRFCYGNTETFTLGTGFPAGTSRETAADSHGLPLPGNSVKIVDPIGGETVATGEKGEVAIKGPTLMLGYIGVPLDETLDDEGYFRTGDGGFLDAAGRLHWQGRLNDIIKTGGANVSPVEIDAVIRAFAGVKLAQTVGVPHDTLGEIVVCCVVAQPGAALDEQAVRGFAAAQLASYKVPRRVLFFAEEALHLTGSAKIKTADLRALVARTLAAPNEP